MQSANTKTTRNEYEDKTCPLCGEDIKLLPAHLRHSCSVADDQRGTFPGDRDDAEEVTA